MADGNKARGGNGKDRPRHRKTEFDGKARRLIAGASKILDPRMRLAYFVERWRALSDDAAIEVLRVLVERAGNRDPGALGVLEALGEGDALTDGMRPQRISRIYHGAARREYPEVVRLLSRPRVFKHFGEEDDEASQYALKNSTLGERRYLARGRDRDTLDRLTYDLDPLVIRELLGNPLVVEKDVIKIAARRPTTPDVLAEVARHPRWSARQRIKEAVVRNPYVDTRLALKLVPTLLVPQLREVAMDAEVHPEISGHARVLYENRGSRRRGGGGGE